MVNLHISIIGMGKPLVLFHGWGFNSNVWKFLIPELSQDFRLFLVDLPGFGKSPLISWDNFKEELLNQLPQKFNLLGWSMGGLYASRLTIDIPERIHQLILASAIPYFISRDNFPGVRKKILRAFYQQFLKYPQMTHQLFLERHLGKLRKKFSPSDFALTSISGANAGLKAMLEWNLMSYLSGSFVPVSCIYGDEDGLIPQEAYEYLTSLPWVGSQMIQGAAHMPHLTHQDNFIRAIRGIL